MKNIIMSVVVGALVGLGAGYSLFKPVVTNNEEVAVVEEKSVESMKSEESMPMKTMHALLEVDKSKPTPEVSLKAFKDSMDGYNLHLETKNFTFTPEKAGGSPVVNTGHAHLFVNGEKVGRVYGSWVNLSSKLLKDGENTVKVTLNADNHSEWAVDGHHIGAEVKVTK